MFDYILIMRYELTPGGRLINRLPYSYEWAVCISSLFFFGELLEDNLELPRLLILVS